MESVKKMFLETYFNLRSNFLMETFWLLSVFTGDRNILQILKTRWWKYLLMGLADVEANYTVVKAYQYTTLTSIQVRTSSDKTVLKSAAVIAQ